MKHRLIGCLAVAAGCIALLAGCDQRDQPAATPAPSAPTAAATAESSPEADGSALVSTGETASLIYMDFTAGSEVEDVRPVCCAAPAEDLCASLTRITGIPFHFSLSWQQRSCTVTWQPESALWSDQTPQGEGSDYLFYDEDLLHWFMLDTVWRTLQQSYGAETVYYRTQDNQAPDLTELWPLEHFDLNQPYRGSAWYYGESVIYREEWEVLDQTDQS